MMEDKSGNSVKELIKIHIYLDFVGGKRIIIETGNRKGFTGTILAQSWPLGDCQLAFND
jgi:hypothetical protein